MITLESVTLEGYGVQLQPMQAEHAAELGDAAADGELWQLWYTSVPRREQASDYIAAALHGMSEGHMLPWIVRDLFQNQIVGSTRYHDIVPTIDRVEIGYTWYARTPQRSHINSASKYLLLRHAFETLGCQVVGFRTDNFNFASQRAIEALGAKRDGVLRHHRIRSDGSVRDTYIYSILQQEWPDVQKHLLHRLNQKMRAANL